MAGDVRADVGGIEVDAARSFVTTHGRLLERRRLERLLGEGDSNGVMAAVDAYRNEDGGYGWGLEPDLRSAESQPAGALHALEVFAEVGPVTTSPRAVELCDWLGGVTLTDGGLPFALPVSDATGCSPWWVQADPSTSSLQITAAVTAKAHQVARYDHDVADHPWLRDATRYCLGAIEAFDARPAAYELRFALDLLDTVADHLPEAAALLDRLARFLPDDGRLPVAGGTDAEALHPLDYAPLPNRPVRRLVAGHVIAADLERLAGAQQADGGWPIDWAPSSPAATLEWRAYETVRALAIWRGNRPPSA